MYSTLQKKRLTNIIGIIIARFVTIRDENQNPNYTLQLSLYKPGNPIVNSNLKK